MTTVMITHEVENVKHWLASPRRAELFGPLGITLRLFVDPTVPHRVGIVANVPDMNAFKQMLASPAGAEAMKFDGVRPATIQMLVES